MNFHLNDPSKANGIGFGNARLDGQRLVDHDDACTTWIFGDHGLS